MNFIIAKRNIEMPTREEAPLGFAIAPTINARSLWLVDVCLRTVLVDLAYRGSLYFVRCANSDRAFDADSKLLQYLAEVRYPSLSFGNCWSLCCRRHSLLAPDVYPICGSACGGCISQIRAANAQLWGMASFWDHCDCLPDRLQSGINATSVAALGNRIFSGSSQTLSSLKMVDSVTPPVLKRKFATTITGGEGFAEFSLDSQQSPSLRSDNPIDKYAISRLEVTDSIGRYRAIDAINGNT